jgi:hypothetical protein
LPYITYQYLGFLMKSLCGRWASVTVLAVAGFAGCWAILQFWDGVEAPVALGWAILPFSILMALGGAWADRARKDDQSESAPSGSNRKKKTRIVQTQHALDYAQQLQIGRDIRMVNKDE